MHKYYDCTITGHDHAYIVDDQSKSKVLGSSDSTILNLISTPAKVTQMRTKETMEAPGIYSMCTCNRQFCTFNACGPNPSAQMKK